MAKSDGKFIVDRYRDDAVLFAQEVLGVEKLEEWQEQVLTGLSEGEQRIAVGSGHGVGKTALTSFIILWFMSTRPHPQIVVTANTEPQLKTKTWRELSKWHQKAKNREWFEYVATKFYLKDDPNTWFASAIPWTENRSEAFAGTHEKHVLYIFDEASAIADIIWEVSEGAMTTTGARWCAFGNMTRNTGRFAECWGKFRHRWKTYSVDSREVSITDKEQIQDWIDDYGEDSDFVRIRVKGMLPRSGTFQFISAESVAKCMKYKDDNYHDFPLVFGVDIARFGDDQNVVVMRQGRKVLDIIKWRDVDTMQSASKVTELIQDRNPQLVFIDGDGVGGGVVDRVKQLVKPELIYECNGGRKADDSATYHNKRAENWGLMKEAINEGIDLPDDNELRDDLIGPEYLFDNTNRIQLERKEIMKKRGLASPDSADALAMTYAKKVMKPVIKQKYYQRPSGAFG